jgi:acylpyruvate hydrolase
MKIEYDDVWWEAAADHLVVRLPGAVATECAALRHVAGYTVVNDVTVRDWQHRTREFLSGKTFENTAPRRAGSYGAESH